MVSQLHESHLLLFRNQPTLAAELLRDVLRTSIPQYNEARIASGDLTDIQPAEYRADLVIHLRDGDRSVFGIIVEVQLSEDGRKRFVWPAYAAALRRKFQCPVALLVVAASETVARWAARPIETGGLYPFAPYVLGPSAIPHVTALDEACNNPELAVLSAMAHGRDVNTERAIQIATVAQSAVLKLDAERSKLYFDLIRISLSKAARRALNNMSTQKYEYKSYFARHYVAQGRNEGRAEGREQGRLLGRAELIQRQLSIRFGSLTAEIQNRLEMASATELDAVGERLLTACTLRDVFSESSCPR